MASVWNSSLHVFSHINLTVIIIIFVVGIIGNAIALIVFKRESKKNASNFHLLLAHLAAIDLLSTIIYPGMLMYLTRVDWRQWHFGDIGCKVLRSLPPVFTTLSQCVLMLISYQRYRAVSKPLEPPISIVFIRIWLCISMLVSIVTTIPWTLTLKILQNPVVGLSTCSSSAQAKSIYGFILNFTFDSIMLARDFISCGFIFACGQLSIQCLQRNMYFYSSHQNLLKRTKNAKKLLNSIALVYCICIIPIDILHVVYFSMRTAHYKFSSVEYEYLLVLLTSLKTLQAAQSSINPLLYSRRIKEFRKVFKLKSRIATKPLETTARSRPQNQITLT